MLINFCHSGLASVEVKQPCSEDNPVSNLISNELSQRNKGFIAERFVKPPVVVEIKFVVSINVHRIKLNCVVGTQKSSTIQIIIQNVDLSERTVAYDSLCSSERGFVFYRHGTAIDEKAPGFKYTTFNNDRFLLKVRSLKVRVLRTDSSTVPALGGIEIWGVVSKLEPKSTVQSVYKIWNEIRSSGTGTPDKPDEEEHCTSQKPNIDITNFEVPEEFLDPITWDILTLPMTLPCGKVVDMSTLEKFYKAEEELGRGQSDPFTGLPFTETRKPVVASLLKTRLDKFLLQNSDQPLLKDIPRTIGRKNPHTIKQDTSSVSYAPSSSTLPANSSSCGKRPWDIDSLLESTLSGLPSYLEKPIQKKEKKDCVKCNSSSMLFRLQCNHLMCRTCLVHIRKTDYNKCLCGSVIDYDSMERYHPV